MSVRLAAEIVAAYLRMNHVEPVELPSLIKSTYDALVSAGQAAEPPAELVPAVPIKRSITPDFLVCLEDGKKLTMLKRHLMASYGLTPEAYRSKWGLPHDYPMVAPNYAQRRSELAVKIGLGRKRGGRGTKAAAAAVLNPKVVSKRRPKAT